jgi:PIN domain nuclease of toxin-antitoxin system
MSTVFDASALIALLRDEPGAEVVQSLLQASPQENFVHALNLCEVYYDFWRASGRDVAEAAIADLLAIGIQERNDLDPEFWREVGRIKAVHRPVSPADCCALGLAGRLGARLATADRHEMEPLLPQEPFQIAFIR